MNNITYSHHEPAGVRYIGPNGFSATAMTAAQIWLLATLLVAAFWIAVGYGIYALT